MEAMGRDLWNLPSPNPAGLFTGLGSGDLRDGPGACFLWSYNIWGPTLTLQDCLSAFFSADELTGDNMYSCEKCGKLRNGMKYCKILELPEILCIHLKRFRHDSLVYTKISTYVTFPLFDLDMKQFLHKDCKNDVYMYNLLSCIVHYGRAGGGHYTTYSLNSINNEWYEFDDNEVRKVDAAQVQNADAYILFYRKKESNITDTYDNIRHLLDNDQNRLLPFYISKSWINRLFYFAEPGPITNNDFLCKHGGVLPNYWSVIKNLVYPAPETVWEYLYRKFGGGPVCNILYPCRKCQLDEENLKRRQRYEKATFLELKRNESDSHAVYALSPTWFRDWENFVCEKSSNPPGPISNQGISVTKNGISKPSKTANCRQLSEKIWNFLYETYGGGPVLLIRSNSSYSMINNALTTTESNNNNNNNNNNIDDISSQETTATTKPPVTFV
ncbi:unnamed protein product [Didymodactylos carnosus]|uniref:ubiquitinyl hydrolase 1 n=1 Tax=Didymodactylos carnosus TaxID=1234261 RepID=A0A8S2CZH6_9BILA|nr:unnamed protein product [Didymodactylos carnosus]CAF3624740.1 unnamed protein product [Didymodactylos carnosus]